MHIKGTQEVEQVKTTDCGWIYRNRQFNYRLWNPMKRRVDIYKNVKFDECTELNILEILNPLKLEETNKNMNSTTRKGESDVKIQ